MMQDIPVLTVNDTFLVEEQQEQMLKYTMQQAVKIHAVIEVDHLSALVVKH